MPQHAVNCRRALKRLRSRGVVRAAPRAVVSCIGVIAITALVLSLTSGRASALRLPDAAAIGPQPQGPAPTSLFRPALAAGALPPYASGGILAAASEASERAVERGAAREIGLQRRLHARAARSSARGFAPRWLRHPAAIRAHRRALLRRLRAPRRRVRRIADFVHVSTTTYTSNTEWTVANSPYVLDGSVTVAAGATLTIDPGVIVKFNGTGRSLYVNGTLNAVGTATNHIVFTSYQDDSAGGDTNGDGSATTGAPGQWYMIWIRSAGSQLAYTDIRYGGYGSAQNYAPVDVSGSGHSATLVHATITNNQQSAVVADSHSSVSISNSTLSNNNYGLFVDSSTATVDHTTIASNSSRGVWFNLPGAAPIPAASSITNSDITGNTSWGILIYANGDYPLASMPTGIGDNIYGSNSNGQQLYVSGYPSFKNADVNWRGNYWGDNVYYWYGAAGCSGSSPNSFGHLAYRSSSGNVPSGPLGGGSYTVGSSWCGYDYFKLGDCDFYTTKLDGSAQTPWCQTFGSADGKNPTDDLADPVNSATGSFDHSETDLSLPGTGVPFSFTRSYNSLDVTKGELGQGWSDSFAASMIVKSNGDVTVHSEDGQQVAYTRQPDGSFVGAPGSLSTLASVTGGYDLTRTDQTKLHFDSNGRLLSSVDRNGQGLTLAYGGDGKLATVTDAARRTITFTHNASGLLTQITMPDTTSVSYGYNGSGQLTSYTDQRGQVWTYTYDSHGFLASEIDPLNHTQFQNTYGNDGRVTQQVDALNHTTTFSWDQPTQTETVTDPRSNTWKDVYAGNVLTKQIDPTNDTTQLGHSAGLDETSVASPTGATTTMTYDSRGNLLTATAPASLGSVTKTFAYNARNDVSSVTDGRGKVTTYGYDSSGNNTSVVQDGQTVAQSTYNTSGQLTSSTDGNGKTTTYTYDANGNLASRTDPLGNKTTYTYDAAGRVLTRVDPLGNVAGNNPVGYTTTYTYDAAGHLLTESDPLGNATTYTYDAAGNKTSVTDSRGNTTTYAYDAANRLRTVTEPDPDGAGPLASPITTYGYDAAGNQTTVTDALTHTTTSTYDADNRLASTTTPLGEKTTYTYDANGNLATAVDPRGNVTGANPSDYTTSYSYDAAGRLVSKTDPLEHQTSYAYDAVGNRTSVTDANNHTTSYTYDAFGRVLTVTAPDGGVTTYAYDGAGNALTRTDANNHTTTYTYDANGELTSKTSPIGQEWTYSYDANGNRVGSVDANGNATQTAGDGTTTFTYDHANRLKTIGYSDSTPGITYAYDASGNRTAMTDGAGTVAYAYDGLNRLTTVTRASDAFSYTYDAAGNITSRTYPDGTVVPTTYDADNRSASVVSGGATTSYAYDAAGNLVQTTLPASNGYTETRTYDRAGRVIDVKNANNSSVLSEYGYTLDPVGNPTTVTETGAVSSTTTYGYDANDRLTSVCFQASCPGSNDPFIRWAYDQVGNRLTETRPSGTTSYGYDAADELTSAGATTYSYDHDGNETAAGSRTFAYDLANRLLSTTSGATTTSYTYDGDGNRLEASTGVGASEITNYLWDTNNALPQVALERDGAGALIRRYIYGNRRISMSTPVGTFYYSYDSLGSVVNMTSSTGAPEWTYEYEPFGSIRTATQNDPNAPNNEMKFAGELADATGLYYLRARQYDPTTGRLLADDPVPSSVDEPAASSYIYAGNRPTVMVDPSGETFTPVTVGSDFALFATNSCRFSRYCADLQTDYPHFSTWDYERGKKYKYAVKSRWINIRGPAVVAALKLRLQWKSGGGWLNMGKETVEVVPQRVPVRASAACKPGSKRTLRGYATLVITVGGGGFMAGAGPERTVTCKPPT
jgi:RHS repeat-associated protein